MLSPTHWTPFLFRPLHASLVWCWPACVWSVYGHVVAAAVVLLVHGCVSRLMVGLFGVGSLALLRAFARSDVVRVVVLLLSVLVGRARVGLRLGLCCLLGRGWCCAGAWLPSWWGLLRWCVAPPMVGCAVLVRASRQHRHNTPHIGGHYHMDHHTGHTTYGASSHGELEAMADAITEIAAHLPAHVPHIVRVWFVVDATVNTHQLLRIARQPLHKATATSLGTQALLLWKALHSLPPY